MKRRSVLNMSDNKDKPHFKIFEDLLLLLLFVSLILGPASIFLSASSAESGIQPVAFLPLAESSLSIFQWVALASLGLSSACFSFFRMLDYFKEIQFQVRYIGIQLMRTSLFSLTGLAASFGLIFILKDNVTLRGHAVAPSWGNFFVWLSGVFWLAASLVTFINGLVVLPQLFKIISAEIPRRGNQEEN